ncbi:hypothetical protein V7S43_015718 [Phytophthora oleae]|uniref:Uncharacterized protein n=1 Tax=Phytophthora oleae TaxID=2107226 RepID=A0ABD3EXF1_9STRA
MAPPEEPESHEEDESEPEVDPELLWALVESELDVESIKTSESLADESDVADSEDTEAAVEALEDDVEVDKLEVADDALEEVVLALEEEDVEFVAVAAVETLKSTIKTTIRT